MIGIGAALLATAAAAAGARASGVRRVPAAAVRWVPPPPSPRLRERLIETPDGARLWCGDTGGDGPPVVLLHPATGSADVWAYQQAPLVKAGFRVIAYARRGHARSSALSADALGSGARDLMTVVDALGLRRLHLVGSAAGGFLVPDFALSRGFALASMTIASSFGGFTDPDYRATLRRLAPPGFDALPASFRELGPSYRAAHPDGVAMWEALEVSARHGPKLRQPSLNDLSWSAVERIRVRTLFIGGDADLYIPPSLMRTAASHIANSTVAVLPEVGHSAYWEQPEQFNRTLISFLRQ